MDGGMVAGSARGEMAASVFWAFARAVPSRTWWLGGTLICYMGHDVILEVPVFRVHLLCYMYALSHTCMYRYSPMSATIHFLRHRFGVFAIHH